MRKDHFENRLIVIKEKRMQYHREITQSEHEIEKHSPNEIEIAHNIKL